MIHTEHKIHLELMADLLKNWEALNLMLPNQVWDVLLISHAHTHMDEQVVCKKTQARIELAESKCTGNGPTFQGVSHATGHSRAS